MLTKVYLDGPIGEQFGNEWELDISSAREAIKMIDANSPGIIKWVRDHAQKYSHYQVVVEYQSGDTESLSEDDYLQCRGMTSIRFVPIIEGSGKWTNAIIGAVLIVIGTVFPQYGGLVSTGWKMLATGVISALLTRTGNVRLASSSGGSGNELLSEVFDGPTNNMTQGAPVPLIYGRCLVGSQVISAGVIIDQLG